MAKRKQKNKYEYADLSARKDTPNTKFNNFTFSPPTNTGMLVYQSGHRAYGTPGWHTTLNTYDHYIIHYILNGKGTYYAPSGEYPIHKGDLFLIKPNEAIHYQSDVKDPYSYYWVGFNGNEAFNIMKLCGFSDTSLVQYYGDDSKLREVFHRLAYPKFSDTPREYELLSSLYELFALLIQKHPHPSRSNAEQYLTRAIEYIQQKYSHSDLKVNDIANYVGIDRTYLYRIFYDFFQQSVQEFIQQFRLNKAKNLLKFSDISVGVIASSCGFENQAYFSTIFKKHFHMTPLQYRKQISQIEASEISNGEMPDQTD